SLYCLVSSSTRGGSQSVSSPDLQRLARQLSPAYNQCSHPFHSYLCNPAPRSRTVTPEGSASFTVKQIEKPLASAPAPSFGVKTIAVPPELQPDPSSNNFRKQTPKQLISPTKATIEDPAFANCQQHTITVEPPTTQKTIVISGESSFSRESKLAPEPYLPPPEPRFPAPSFQQPLKLSLPTQPPTKKPLSTPEYLPETYPKPSATFVQSENILTPFQNKNFQTTTTIPERFSSTKTERTLFEGQAAGSPESVIRNDNEVDNCKHSFHSFLCNPPSLSRGRRPITNSRTKPISSPTGDSTFLDPSKVLPPILPASQKIKPKPTTTSRPTYISTTPPTETKIFAEAAEDPVQVLPLQDQKQPSICKDAFHSFLCQPVDTSRRKQKYGERYQSSAARTPVPSAPLRGDSSFNQPSKVLPNFNQPCNTTPSTEAPSASFPSRYTPRAESSSPKRDSLGNQTKAIPTTNRQFVSSSTILPTVPVPKPDSTFIQPARLLLPSTQSTTMRATPGVPETHILNVPAAQTADVSVVKPEDGHRHDHSHDHGHGHDHHGIDICKDPFHSFLCIPVVPSKRKRPTGELPARFRNPVPQNLLGAGSFNQPAKLLPSNAKKLTTRLPVRSTTTSLPPDEPISPTQPAQGFQAKLLPQPEIQLDPKEEHSRKRLLDIFSCDKNKSTTENPAAYESPLPSSNLKGDSSFVNPSKVLQSVSLNDQSSESKGSVLGYEYPTPSPSQQTATPLPTSAQNTGYVYDPPSKPLQYPASSFRGDSTFIQPLKIAPNNFSGQSTENREFSSGFNEFSGYNYPTPQKPFGYSTISPLTKSVLSVRISEQDTNNQEDKPTKSVQFLDSPFGGILGTSSSDTEYRKTLTPFSTHGQSTKGIIPQTPPYNPYSKLAERDNQLRSFAKLGGETDPKPTCDHSLPQSTDVHSPRSAPPSPSEFVRGPTGAASVLAASNELPDKCNHPFLGYVCKRSSDGQVHDK
ncbi:hypothetical protein B7P43_G04346, partial [Cryptotermes secundus]